MSIIKNLEMSKVINLKDQIEYIPNQHSMKFITKNDNLSLVLLSLDENITIPTHHTTGDALIFILEGEGIFNLNGTDFNLKAGETIVIPANMPHSVRGKTKLKFSLTIVK